MTRDEILSMAREAGFSVRGENIRTMHSSGAWVGINDELAKFAELATAKERAARIDAQQRLADAQELLAKSGLAHRKAVQDAVSDAMKRMQAGEKLSYTDKDVELIMLGCKSELNKAVAAEREACAKLAEGQTYLSRASLSSILGDDAVASCHVASAIRARGTP